MRYVSGRRIKLFPDIQTFAGRLGLVLVTLLLASCGSSGDAPQQPSPPLGDDPSLSALTISDGTLNPVFTPSVTDYAASVPHGMDNIVVSVTASDSDASVTINGGVDTNIPLSAGDNTISILVTAENGTTTRTYTIVVTRVTSDNASLSSLALSNAAFDPEFEQNVLDYVATVGFFTRSTQITATTESDDATISVNGTVVTSGVTSESITLAEGSNTITVNVTAEDGFTTQSYTVVVTRQRQLAYSQKAYVKASDPTENDAFGARLTLSGDGVRLVVGAPFTIPGLTDFCGEDPWLGRPQPTRVSGASFRKSWSLDVQVRSVTSNCRAMVRHWLLALEFWDYMFLVATAVAPGHNMNSIFRHRFLPTLNLDLSQFRQTVRRWQWP
jgi:hypothetical protein